MISQTLFDTFTQMGRLTSGLPFKTLYCGKQRQALGGYLFTEGPPIVAQFARCMNRQPELFAEYPVSGDRLLGLQAEADGWLALKRRLEELLVKVNDSYLSTQAEANRSALDVAKFIEHEVALPANLRGTRSVARQKALWPALIVLYTYRQWVLKTKAKCKKKREEIAGNLPLAVEIVAKHKKRQARKKTEKRRSENRAHLDDQIKAALANRRQRALQPAETAVAPSRRRSER